jgi:hypothetical protein
MPHGAAIAIVLGCIAFALLVCTPFLFLARRRRRQRTSSVTGHVPVRELPALFAYVVIMFYGFAQAYTEPNSWFGQQMSTNTGRIAFLVGPAAFLLAVRAAWRCISRVKTERASGSGDA